VGRYSNQREAAQKAEAEHVARRYEEQARAKEEREGPSLSPCTNVGLVRPSLILLVFRTIHRIN
jgi:hypothetical protein